MVEIQITPPRTMRSEDRQKLNAALERERDWLIRQVAFAQVAHDRKEKEKKRVFSFNHPLEK